MFILLSGICDIIDGKVTRKTGQSSKFGAILDSSLDRYAELFMFLGTAIYFVQMDHPITSIVVFLALGGSMMVSYVRGAREGLGFDCKVGIMERPERIVFIGVSSLDPSLSAGTGDLDDCHPFQFHRHPGECVMCGCLNERVE